MKDGFIKVAAATPQIRVADPEYNANQIMAMIDHAETAEAKVVVFPELCLTGYTCGDLFLQDRLLKEAREQLLSRLLEPVKQNYDYILIDCPPSLGIVTTNAFLAADEIIVPMTPELLPLKGMRMLDSFVSTLQRVKPNLRLGGVFIARFNHRKLNKVVEQAVKSRYETITMQTRIRENIALAESAGSGQSIFEYDPQSNGAKDYQALTEEIISRNQ